MNGRIVELLDIIYYPFGHVTAADAETDWPEGGPIRRAVDELQSKFNLILEELERISNALSKQRDACFRRGLQDASSGYGEGASLTFRLLDAIKGGYLEEYVAESRAEG